jgi:molybdopterin-guanine dinucleotide biosynthesis protein A
MVPWKEVTLGLLAGGQGRRLGGVAKGLLEVEGRPVLGWLLDLAPGLGGVLLGANEPAPYAAFGLTVVGDVVAGKGAPGGVVSLLEAATTPWVLCVACDMPFVRREHVEALRLQTDGSVDAVVAARGGSMEPLCGLYRSSLGARWRPALVDDPSLRALVASVRFEQVELDPRALDSLNTPDELAHAQSRRG